jgi:outer membrane protein OmpA-like peptidoglycan-associated protein
MKKYLVLCFFVVTQTLCINNTFIFAQKIKMQGTPHKFEKKQGNGLTAEYESKGENIVKSYNSIDSQINFAWDTAVSQYAIANIDVLDFTVKWLGGVYAPKAGKYTFSVEADDGCRLFLNDYPIIDEWREQAQNTFAKEVHLKGEQIYDLRVDYVQLSGGKATIKLKWKFENETESIIPQKYLFADYNRRPLQPTITFEPEIKPKAAEKDEFEDLLKKRKLTLNHISFEKGSTKLKDESFEELDKLVQTLKANPTIRIEVAGHTDNVGDAGVNLRLSKLRAVSVANYLISKGIDEKRVVPVGYGSKEPLVDNFTEEDRIKNRRVELKVLN